MKKFIFIFISLILILGCSMNRKNDNYKKQFAVKSPKSAYGKKYHFILESRFKSRSKDISGMFGADKYVL